MKEIFLFRKNHPLKFTKEHTALLVLDMQRYFYDETSHAYVSSMKNIIPAINCLIEFSRHNDIPVIFTRHEEDTDVKNSMKRWWKGTINHNDAEIIKEIRTDYGIILTKYYYDAFYKTDLEKILKEQKIENLIISGVMTHLCCETTARSAFMRGFEVYFTIDGTATYNEDFHRASLLNLAHGFAYPVLVEEIVSLRGGSFES